MSSPGSRGGYSYGQILTRNLMEDPGPQNTLRYELLTGVQRAQEHSMDPAGIEYRNYRRSQGRLPQCRGVVKA